MSEPSIATYFRHAYELLIRSPLSRGAAARNAQGKEVPSTSPDACLFCSLGAMLHVSGGDHAVSDEVLRELETQLALREGREPRDLRAPIFNWNDTHTKEQILELWKDTGVRCGWLAEETP